MTDTTSADQGDADAEQIDPSIPMHVLSPERLSRGDFVTAEYAPTRDTTFATKTVRGEVQHISEAFGGPRRIRLSDPVRERDITITLGETVGESDVTSHGKLDTTLGWPVSVKYGDSDMDITHQVVARVSGRIDDPAAYILALAQTSGNRRALSVCADAGAIELEPRSEGMN